MSQLDPGVETRQIESEISVAKAAPGFDGEADDLLYLKTIAVYVKKMDKARREYEAAGERGIPNAEKLAWEIQYLARWLPQALSEDETRRTVRAAIAELNADDPKLVGPYQGKFDEIWKALAKSHRLTRDRASR